MQLTPQSLDDAVEMSDALQVYLQVEGEFMGHDPVTCDCGICYSWRRMKIVCIRLLTAKSLRETCDESSSSG